MGLLNVKIKKYNWRNYLFHYNTHLKEMNCKFVLSEHYFFAVLEYVDYFCAVVDYEDNIDVLKIYQTRLLEAWAWVDLVLFYLYYS